MVQRNPAPAYTRHTPPSSLRPLQKAVAQFAPSCASISSRSTERSAGYLLEDSGGDGECLPLHLEWAGIGIHSHPDYFPRVAPGVCQHCFPGGSRENSVLTPVLGPLYPASSIRHLKPWRLHLKECALGKGVEGVGDPRALRDAVLPAMSAGQTQKQRTGTCSAPQQPTRLPITTHSAGHKDPGGH